MTDIVPADAAAPSDLSLAVIHLLKGPVYRDTHEKIWALLLNLRNQVADHLACSGCM